MKELLSLADVNGDGVVNIQDLGIVANAFGKTTPVFLSTFFLPIVFAQDSHQWRLPEGAIGWFGKGRIYDMQYSPDGTRLAVATSCEI